MTVLNPAVIGLWHTAAFTINLDPRPHYVRLPNLWDVSRMYLENKLVTKVINKQRFTKLSRIKGNFGYIIIRFFKRNVTKNQHIEFHQVNGVIVV